MKKNVLALSIAAAVTGFAGSAHAIQTLGSAATADALQFGNTGTGHMLVVPYFSTQDGNSTLLSIVNTNQTIGKAVKVRFRGASNSDDVFDFQVFLSPGDVWTANISANADGLSYLTTTDNTCTKPAKSVLNSTPFITARLNPAASAEAKAAGTREGYVEIFNMADIPESATGVYPLIKHNASGVAGCADTATNTSWTALNTDLADEAAYAAQGLVNPTTGLAANWTIINVPKAISWSGEAAAVEAVVTATGAPGIGNVVYFPQSAAPVADTTGFTADPLLKGATAAAQIVKAGLYDLPDMSTPYLTGAGTPEAQATSLTAAIAATSVMNEYVTDPAIDAATDWVFSMPTRRYSAAVNYAASPMAAVYNGGITGYFTSTNTTLNGDQLCVTGVAVAPWDREERSPAAPDDVVISPGTPTAPTLFCGEASVLSFNNGSTTKSGVLGASVALKDIDLPYQDGWAALTTPGATPANGLPILGQSFVSAYNPAVAAGVAGNFGMGWAHRFTRP